MSSLLPKPILLKFARKARDPEFLPLLINTWIDVYLDARAEDIKKLTGNTTQYY